MHFPLTSAIFRPEHCDPLFLLRELGLRRDYCALLESADRHGSNNFSFVALGARDRVIVQDGMVSGSRYIPDGKTTDALSMFENMFQPSDATVRLSMGYIGFLSFEAARHFESVALPPNPDIPDAMFVLPEVLLKIDHGRKTITMIAHDDSREDLREIERALNTSPYFDDRRGKQDMPGSSAALPTIEDIETYRQTSREDFCASVKKIQEEILAGEAFQVVLSQELRIPNGVPPDRVYEELRKINPSPYMYYYQTPQLVIVGASPETLVRVEGRDVLYRPIAGTRRRTGDPEQDRAMHDELISDEKERCEHQMLVDLGRSDIGRIAEIGSVRVQDPFHVEQYAHVFHIVSDITARIREGCSSLDVLRSVFPAGTLTGAPKVRAMEIIRRLEGGPRGIYGGAFGYIDLGGNLDFAITIRTMLFQNNVISLRVGAGIVKDSIPEREDDECLHKARSCLAALHLARTSLVAS